jgi:hypothetical protein
MQNGVRPGFPYRNSGLTKLPVHSSVFRSCDYATLDSNPRKPNNQSMPSHIFALKKSQTPVLPSVVLNYDLRPLALAQPQLEFRQSVNEPSDAVKRRYGKEKRGL